MAKTKQTITVGEIEAKSLVFSDGGNGRWVTCAQPMDYIEFHKRFASDYKDGLNWKQATGVNMDDGCAQKFYAVAVQDCFDPPVAIIRAENMEDAEDRFVDELPWAHISDADEPDYRVYPDPAECVPGYEGDFEYSDAISFNGSGQAYDSEGIVIWEVKLIRIELE